MSLKDSKDSIELLYGKEVLANFPNYEVFWVKFIGNPKAKQVKPYNYIFPSAMDQKEKNRILEEYEKIQMVHYSLFCHFAGAHFQLREMEKNEKIQDLKERYFEHWEHFEVGYIHLGSVFYMFKMLWAIVCKLKNFPGKFREIDGYLESKGNNIVNRLNEIEMVVKTRRDQAVHYGRVMTLPHKDKFYVPREVYRDMKWSDGDKIQKWIETIAVLRKDITETEKLINDLHRILISEYEDFVVRNNIKIDYSE